MKKFTALLLTIGISASASSQNINWVNAPLNPISEAADLKYQNLKGDVFQEGYNYYAKDGTWIPYDNKKNRTVDAQGRISSYTNSNGSTTTYSYDSRGNLVKANYQSGSFSFSYEYDSKNRLIKEEFKNNKNESRNSRYSYLQKGDILVVSEKNTSINGNQDETERHFQNGNEIFSQTKGYPGISMQYKFDKKGNWVTQTQLDADTKKPRKNYIGGIVAPSERTIIYHDEYHNRQSNMTVSIKDVFDGKQPKELLVPEVFINGKELKRTFITRFSDDYIFYDPLSTSYYLARNAFSKSHKLGDKIPVEKLLEGSEIILIYNAQNIQLCTNGNPLNNKVDWKYIMENAFYAVANTKEGIYYFFAKPSVTDNAKTIALPAINTTKSDNNIFYYLDREANDLIMYDGIKILTDKFSTLGYVAGTKDIVIAVNGNPKYVLSNSSTVPNKQLNSGRHYNPAKDKVQAAPANNSPKSNTTASVPTATKTPLQINIPDEAQSSSNFIKRSRHNSKIYLRQRVEELQREGMSEAAIAQHFFQIYDQLYRKNKADAFELLQLFSEHNHHDRLMSSIKQKMSPEQLNYYNTQLQSFNAKK